MWDPEATPGWISGLENREAHNRRAYLDWWFVGGYRQAGLKKPIGFSGRLGNWVIARECLRGHSLEAENVKLRNGDWICQTCARQRKLDDLERQRKANRKRLVQASGGVWKAASTRSLAMRKVWADRRKRRSEQVQQ